MKRVSATQDIGHFASKILSKAAKQSGVEYYQLIVNWKKIFGENLSHLVRFEKVSSFKKHGKIERILTLSVPNSTLAFEINLKRALLTEKIASFFGYRYISDIKIIQKNNYRKSEEKMRVKSQDLHVNQCDIEQIEDAELKEALQNLGSV